MILTGGACLMQHNALARIEISSGLGALHQAHVGACLHIIIFRIFPRPKIRHNGKCISWVELAATSKLSAIPFYIKEEAIVMGY